MKYVLVVHGGVETPDVLTNRAVIQWAASLGGDALGSGRLDAVEAAIRVLEAAPAFNAGYGSVLNRDGEIALDGLIVDGATSRAGAVAAIQDVIHAISVARMVLEGTPYVLMAGAGAGLFARERGVPVESCETVEQRLAWQRAIAAGDAAGAGLHPFTGQASGPGRGTSVTGSGDTAGAAGPTEAGGGGPTLAGGGPMVAGGGETVGAVALAPDGTAAGVSTGGLFLKAPGRVGDSAVPGAGAWASPAGAAASTGLGEAFIELQLCRRAVALIASGTHPQAAVEQCLRELLGGYATVAGLIAVDAFGRIGAVHHGTSMPVAAFELGAGLLPVSSVPL